MLPFILICSQPTGSYGPAPCNADSAINLLLDVVLDQSGKTYKMDHFQTRYPTNVLDIASFLVRLAGASSPLCPSLRVAVSLTGAASASTGLPRSKAIPPILHYTAPEPFTKYEICLVFAHILGVSHGHVVSETEPPAGKLNFALLIGSWS